MAVTQLSTGTTIQGSANNYATYTREDGDIGIFIICGDNITLRYLTLDFALDSWQQFTRLVQFGGACNGNTKSNILIEYCDFINTGTAVHPRDGSGDVWGITIDGEADLTGLTIRNCRMLYDQAQLTAGTLKSGATLSNVLIENCTVVGGISNGIGISTRNGVMNNITVRGCHCYEIKKVGIFVGEDATAGTADIDNITIENNFISFDSDISWSSFPKGILVKGDDTNPMTGIDIRRNFVDTTGCSDDQKPRIIDFSNGIAVGDGSTQVTLRQNVRKGTGDIPSSGDVVRDTDSLVTVK